MSARAIFLAAAFAGGLSIVDAWAAPQCGGLIDYYDWDCRYTPGRGWEWQKVLVGTDFCFCDTQCTLVGRKTSCFVKNMSDTCGGGESCEENVYELCHLPAPDPATCTGPKPPADREGWVLHDGTPGTYVPDERFSYNSTGANNVIAHVQPGVFKVTFPGLGGLDGNVQVVAYGTTNDRCQVARWIGMPDLTVEVFCITPTAAPVDTPFLAYFLATDDGPTSSRAIGYARYEWPEDPDSLPGPAFQWNSNGPRPVTTRLDAGDYVVRFRNLMHADGAPVVTALGEGPQFCQVLSTSIYTANGQTGTEVRVWCFDTGGRLDDTSFALRYEWQRAVAGTSAREGYAYASHSANPSYVPDWQFNSTGASNTAARAASGAYSLDYPNLPPPAAMPSPAAYVRASTVLMCARTLVPAFCKVARWSGSPTGTVVNGLCFGPDGREMDQAYQQMYLTRLRLPESQP